MWIKLKFLLFLVNFISADITNSPVIISSNGNLILQPGFDGNISISLKGRSCFKIGEDDFIDIIAGKTSKSVDSHNWDEKAFSNMQTAVHELQEKILKDMSVRVNVMENRTRYADRRLFMRRTRARLNNLVGQLRQITAKLEGNNCTSNPCLHGGRCVPLYNQYMCLCPTEFDGVNCERDVNECAIYAGTDLGCQNNAQCVNNVGGYSCICFPGWVGTNCNQKQKDCLNSNTWDLCRHGTCVNTDDEFGYKCICDQGWKTNGLTPSCNTDVDECKENHPPCASSCVNIPGSFTCAPCSTGYAGNGFVCKDINECETNNGGCSMNPLAPCINTHGSFHCGQCPTGWVGDGKTCSKSDVGLCEQNPTYCYQKAKCDNVGQSMSCTCPTNMEGTGVGPNGCKFKENLSCKSNPCLNNGTCTLTGSTFTCLCPRGYDPPLCELRKNYCESSPCLNGGMCINLSGGPKCNCPYGFIGNHCENQVNRCGGHLSGPVGHLRYPPNGSYEGNARCAWVITTNRTQVLNITFINFSLEMSPECHLDWLQIHDGPNSASHLIGRFCGNNLPKNIVSTRNLIYMWFRSSKNSNHDGFELTYDSIDPICGGLFNVTSHGVIASPGSPSKYPQNRDCEWVLSAPVDKRIQLTFFSLQIEEHNNCNADYLSIYDGPTSNGDLLKQYCTSGQPPSETFQTNELTIKFHSDSTSTDLGFQIHYTLVEKIPGCGGTYSARNGKIQSPSVITSISCEYIISAMKNMKIHLEFDEFKMEEKDCIELWEDEEYFVGRWCGSLKPPGYDSHSNKIVIKYHSEERGLFVASYRVTSDYLFEGDNGTITSPNYPDEYNSQDIVMYRILVDGHKIIKLDFEDFNIEDEIGSNICIFDYLEVYDNLQKIGSFCGVKKPPQIISKTNLLTLKLITDHSRNSKGFKANYSSISSDAECGGIVVKDGALIKPPMTSDGQSYKKSMNCKWTIVAPIGFKVYLHWLSFEIEDSGCSYDYVEFFDGYEHDESRRYCGSEKPASVVSSTNVLTINFVSDESDGGQGFEAKVNFIPPSQTCGKNIITRGSGHIRSPTWPRKYSPGTNCTWTIRTSNSNQQIELSAIEFNLEYSTDCSKDYLEVRDGDSADSPLIGIYCGDKFPKAIPSFGDAIFLKFVTDNSETTNDGFVLSYIAASFTCGGALTSPRGSLSSPNYPRDYLHSYQCDWKIIVNKGSYIKIEIVDLDIEQLFNCEADYLEIFEGLNPTTKDMMKFCGNKEGTTFLQSSTNQVLVRFITDESVSGKGFKMYYRQVCRNILTDFQGTIESPNYPEPYPQNTSCQWTIKAPKGNTIQVHFSVFQLDDLHQDDFKITSGGNVLMNSTSAVKVLNSTANELIIDFNSSVGGGLGFLIEYEVIGCVATLTEIEGTLSSPNFPNPYNNNMDCQWKIQAEYGKLIVLNIVEMEIEKSDGCKNDFVMIYGELKNSHVGTYCGKKRNITVTSSGHIMNVAFSANEQNIGTGFNATYKIVQSACGGIIKASSGMVYSPNYPHNYEPLTYCEWIIEVQEHHTMSIDFHELDIEHESTCVHDSLKFYNDEDDLFFTACGDDLPTRKTSKSNQVKVVFETDDSVSYKGFKFSFKENCGQKITVSENGKIQFYKNEINDSKDCLWVLSAKTPGDHITVTPTHIGLDHKTLFSNSSGNGLCNGKEIIVYEGDSDKAPVKALFCNHAPSITSLGSYLTLKVPTESISEFECTFSILDNSCGGALSGIEGRFSSPKYPDSYANSIQCTWTMSALPGNLIQLDFEDFDFVESDNCNEDYLEIRESSSNGPLLGVFCGKHTPTVDPNKSFWIKLRTDDDDVRKGFMAKFNYVKSNELNETVGTILSPNYPNSFSAFEPYSWRIIAPFESFVVLNWQFLRDDKLHLTKIYDGYDDTADLIPINKNNPSIISKTSTMYIKSTGGAFNMTYTVVPKSLAENSTNSCEHQSVTSPLSGILFITSPNYPNPYNNSADCSWLIAPPKPEYHVEMEFNTIELEDLGICVDFIEVSQSKDLSNWKNTTKFCKKKSNSRLRFLGSPFLKLHFQSDPNINMKGFKAAVSSVCGSEMFGSYGFINLTAVLKDFSRYLYDCTWLINVQYGRRIQLNFSEIQLTNNEKCLSYVLLKNGISENSPNLGIGRLCSNEDFSNIQPSSSHSVTIRLRAIRNNLNGGIISFTEILSDCSKTIQLLGDEKVDISTPNWPNIPNPKTECVWNIVAPLHRTISLDFQGNIDLGSSCDKEYIELRDGATDRARSLGRLCSKDPANTVYSSGNMLKIVYFNDVSEPRPGFSAKAKLALCGGTFGGTSGVINFPETHDVWSFQSDNLTCEYFINSPPHQSLNVSIDMSLFGDAFDYDCDSNSNRIELFNEDDDNLYEPHTTAKICYNTKPLTNLLFSSKALIKVILFKKNRLQNQFKLTYNTVDGCQQEIIATEGIIRTPGYPIFNRRILNCVYKIKVPKGKRIKLEILDINVPVNMFKRLAVYNDWNKRAVNNFNLANNEVDGNIVYSTDNLMAITVFVLNRDQVAFRGLKLKFSSEEESELCNINNENEGSLKQNLTALGNQSYYCEFEMEVEDNTTLALKVKSLDIITESDGIAFYTGKAGCDERFLTNVPFYFINEDKTTGFCSNVNETKSYRLISNTILKAQKARLITHLKSFDIVYKKHPCGGIFNLDNKLTITQPQLLSKHDGELECAWKIEADPSTPTSIELNVDFKSKCNEEYLTVYFGPYFTAPRTHFCEKFSTKNLTNLHSLYIEYYSSKYNSDSELNVTVIAGSDCGGLISEPFRNINFRDIYKNNMECIWDIRAKDGHYISLNFTDRFFIEDSLDCMKDQLLVQDMVGDKWTILAKLCGRNPPSKILESSSSKMRLIFRSDNENIADGFTAEFTSSCGGILYAADDPTSVKSLSYRVEDLSVKVCNYTILNPTNENILVEIEYYPVGIVNSMKCESRNLTVTRYNYSFSDQSVETFCTTLSEYEIRSGNKLEMLFYGAFPFFSYSFIFKKDKCGGTVQTPTTISSPLSKNDGLHPPNIICVWNITAPVGQKIIIKFLKLDMEYEPECTFDKVQVFNGKYRALEQRMVNLCGNITNVPMISIPNHYALLTSESDHSSNSKGFEAQISFVENCDQDILLGLDNLTSHLNVGGYRNSMDCNLKIRAPHGYTLTITFESFHVEDCQGCECDYLEVYDAAGPFGDKIGKFCGHNLPNPIVTTKHSAYLRFVSDENMPSTGINFTVTATVGKCGSNGQIVLDSQQTSITIKYPEHNNYLPNMNCLWNITAPGNIHIEFNKLSIEDYDEKGECSHDYLQLITDATNVIEEGYGPNTVLKSNMENTKIANFFMNQKHKYCGSKIPSDYYVNSNSVVAKFHSDSVNETEGFQITATYMNGCYKNYTSSQGRVVVSSVKDCDFYIESPANTTLSLYFSFQYFYAECEKEYVEVFDQNNNKSLKKFCNSISYSSSMYTNTSKLRVHLKSSGLFSELGLTYLASKNGPGCGGQLYNYFGMFTSPFYSQSNRHSSDCIWNIQVPGNTVVHLEFNAFDLGSKANCVSDFMQIIEQERNSNVTNVMRQYCGGDSPKEYVSSKNLVSVRFKRTMNFDGSGWVIFFSGVSPSQKSFF